ncbi:DNA polymerase Y family protein [Actinophytocola xinjiangensis]|nr:DNA polymerase Y family protein [Actinophytocola xinjiangensis]
MDGAAQRMLVVWCPDWPVTAASSHHSPGDPLAVVTATLVVAANAVARAEGVRRGMRRREAQGRCPTLVALPDDPDRDARLFEPVAAAVEELAVGVEIIRPGIVAVPARGPAGYFGTEESAAERIIDRVAERTGAECQVGIADTLFAAVLAAKKGLLVGETTEFLAPLSVRELHRPAEGQDRAELVDLLRRLGLRTLGAFAALPERDVAGRFGADAVLAHRLASGRQERPLARRRPPPDLTISDTFDPPVDRVDTAAFVARTLAERLHNALAAHGLACTRLGIHAATAAGQERERVWRCAEPLTPAGLADRVRWQLDGWLRDARLSAGVATLALTPVEVIDGTTLQLDLWRGEGRAEADERAARAMVHVQGLLGPDAVVTPVLGGGRGPGERVRYVPWGDERTPAADPDAPWPGALPAPSPATIPRTPLPARLTDDDGRPVAVTGRDELTGRPAMLALPGRAARPVLGWAGPWTADERWWVHSRRRSRLQVVLEESEKDTQTALLLVLADEKWTVEGIYD